MKSKKKTSVSAFLLPFIKMSPSFASSANRTEKKSLKSSRSFPKTAAGIRKFWENLSVTWKSPAVKNEYLKTLWMLRFEKIKKDEQGAVSAYQQIMEQCLLDFDQEHEVIEMLRRLVLEEKGHVKMSDELIKICLSNHPECEALQP